MHKNTRDEKMPHKRLNITLHPEDIKKLDRICKQRNYKRSTMIAKLIQEYDESKDKGEMKKRKI